ncbi:MAG TPA: hypothetical protein EYP19_07035 [Desulfobacterales bacterium]|nr:hypothetical protein [Desulfobacterales bacterium]
MPRRMLINVREEEESRVAILDDDYLEELYVERHTGRQLVATFTRVESSTWSLVFKHVSLT